MSPWVCFRRCEKKHERPVVQPFPPKERRIPDRNVAQHKKDQLNEVSLGSKTLLILIRTTLVILGEWYTFVFAAKVEACELSFASYLHVRSLLDESEKIRRDVASFDFSCMQKDEDKAVVARIVHHHECTQDPTYS